MGKNVSKLYYPIKQSIMSILPIVDEFVIALGDCDEDDTTRQEIERINSDKIKIIDTVWDIEKYPRGMEHAHQTDIAKEHCSGDWLFYLQADEVVHEKYLPVIKARCEELLHDKEVEGLLFNYVHFWGDYWHYHRTHGWYRNEVRIIRNNPEIRSWESAQSFRKIPDFDGLNYRRKENTFKLRVANANASIYHYGWVRPPKFMKKKIRAINENHRGLTFFKKDDNVRKVVEEFDYGNMKLLSRFTGTHPAVMKEVIDKFNWQDELTYKRKSRSRIKHKHETFRYQFISFLERLVNHPIAEFQNYILLKK